MQNNDSCYINKHDLTVEFATRFTEQLCLDLKIIHHSVTMVAKSSSTNQ